MRGSLWPPASRGFMYLHLGQNVVVPEADVIGIFDLDNTTGSHITRKFLGEAEKAGRIVSVSDDLPKSFVVCGEKNPANEKRASDMRRHIGEKRNSGEIRRKDICNELEIYLSQLSSQTLMKRSEAMRFD